MPIMIQIQGALIDHNELEVPLQNGSTGKRYLVVFTDPVSGMGIQTIFDESEAKVDQEGNIVLLKQTRSDLAIAGPGDMPPPPGPHGQPPQPGQRPPMAGPGTPSR